MASPRAATRTMPPSSRHPLRRLALGLAAALLLPAASAGAEPAGDRRVRMAPCDDPAMPPGARCGTVAVFEDRDARRGRTLDLRVVVVPRTRGGAAAEAVVFLAGGPGDGITRAAAPIAQWMEPVRGERDLLLVDQRGTGESNPLRCPHQEERRRVAEYLADPFAVGRLRECREALAQRADLTLYTTPYAADDLDEVRAALGYDRLDLVGVSYGARLAQVYARRHPARARTLTLLGPAAVDARMPLHMARDLDASLRGSFADCRADAACAAAFPDLPGDLQRALERVAAGVPPVVVPAAAGGGTVEVPVSRQVVVQALRYMLYHPANQARLPAVLHAAAGGDFAPLAGVAARVAAGFNRSADGLYLAVTCAEDVARFTLEEGRAAAVGTLLGAVRVDAQKAACAEWPAGRLPADYWDVVRLDTPALLIVGERDPATPVAWAREIASAMPNALVVVVPQAGHEVSDGMVGGDCVDALPLRFIAAGTARGLDASCAAAARLPPWVLPAAAPAQ